MNKRKDKKIPKLLKKKIYKEKVIDEDKEQEIFSCSSGESKEKDIHRVPVWKKIIKDKFNLENKLLIEPKVNKSNMEKGQNNLDINEKKEMINYESMSKEDLLRNKRQIEDKVIKMNREYEEESLGMERYMQDMEREIQDMIKIHKRTKEDILLNKKRKIEDEEDILRKIKRLLEKKRKEEEEIETID